MTMPFSKREIVGCEASARPSIGSRSSSRFWIGSSASRSASLASGYPARDAEHTLCDQRRQRVRHARGAAIGDAAGQRGRQARGGRLRLSAKSAPIRAGVRLIKRVDEQAFALSGRNDATGLVSSPAKTPSDEIPRRCPDRLPLLQYEADGPGLEFVCKSSAGFASVSFSRVATCRSSCSGLRNRLSKGSERRAPWTRAASAVARTFGSLASSKYYCESMFPHDLLSACERSCERASGEDTDHRSAVLRAGVDVGVDHL